MKRDFHECSVSREQKGRNETVVRDDSPTVSLRLIRFNAVHTLRWIGGNRRSGLSHIPIYFQAIHTGEAASCPVGADMVESENLKPAAERVPERAQPSVR